MHIINQLINISRICCLKKRNWLLFCRKTYPDFHTVKKKSQPSDRKKSSFTPPQKIEWSVPYTTRNKHFNAPFSSAIYTCTPIFHLTFTLTHPFYTRYIHLHTHVKPAYTLTHPLSPGIYTYTPHLHPSLMHPIYTQHIHLRTPFTSGIYTYKPHLHAVYTLHTPFTPGIYTYTPHLHPAYSLTDPIYTQHIPFHTSITPSIYIYTSLLHPAYTLTHLFLHPPYTLEILSRSEYTLT